MDPNAPLAMVELTVHGTHKFQRRGMWGRDAGGDDVWFNDDPGNEDNASNSDWVESPLDQSWNFKDV